MSKLKRWLHRKGVHFYNKPIKNFRKVHYRIPNDRRGYEELYSDYQRRKCEFCNRRKDFEFSRVKRTTGYGI